MKDFYLYGWLLSYDLSKISPKLVIHLKHNRVFAKFLEILLDNNVTFRIHTFVDEAKIILKSFEFMFFGFLLKTQSYQNVFKNALEKFNTSSF